jgi:hypothetical protein
MLRDAILDRRAFLALISARLAGGAALAMARPGPAPAREDGEVFTGLDVFERLRALARERAWSRLPVGERIAAVGMALRQTPYATATLELHEEREVCSVNLRGLDCVTFFESALGFARMLKRGGQTPDALLAEVTFTRYRGGQVTDYASRLHYMTDWFFDNQRKGVLRLITREFAGATRFSKRVSFMSTHPEGYPQLRTSPELVAKIARVEAEINGREMHYLPKERVSEAQPGLMTGDIVGVTTSLEGLDCAHAGLCYRDDQGALRLLHASTTAKAVVLDTELASYLARVSTQTGVMVARPLEVG